MHVLWKLIHSEEDHCENATTAVSMQMSKKSALHELNLCNVHLQNNIIKALYIYIIICLNLLDNVGNLKQNIRKF